MNKRERERERERERGRKVQISPPSPSSFDAWVRLVPSPYIFVLQRRWKTGKKWCQGRGAGWEGGKKSRIFKSRKSPIFVRPSLDAMRSSQNRLRSDWERVCAWVTPSQAKWLNSFASYADHHHCTDSFWITCDQAFFSIFSKQKGKKDTWSQVTFLDDFLCSVFLKDGDPLTIPTHRFT